MLADSQTTSENGTGQTQTLSGGDQRRRRKILECLLFVSLDAHTTTLNEILNELSVWAGGRILGLLPVGDGGLVDAELSCELSLGESEAFSEFGEILQQAA